MLIASARHSVADLEHWRKTESTARLHARLRAHHRQVQRSEDAMLSFTGAGTGYAGVSWGKDSVALAGMIARLVPRWPLVWVRVETWENPDCLLVRDAFLATHPAALYEEIVVRSRDSARHVTGTIQAGFAEAARRYGPRYISGVRAEESGVRKLRVAKHGLVGPNTCAPLGWWTADDVWAYTLSHGLPVHPAYACTMDGALDPGRIRVASLGGQRGTGMGRAEWERRYYRDELIAIERSL